MEAQFAIEVGVFNECRVCEYPIETCWCEDECTDGDGPGWKHSILPSGIHPHLALPKP